MTTKAQFIKWPGESGKEYDYVIYPLGTKFQKTPGNYIFSKETSPAKWTPIYIGETGDLSEHLDNHPKMHCISLNGCTHIHAHRSSAVARVRQREGQDLLKRWKTTCND